MALDVRIIIHGVPSGHKYWGAEEQDESYIDSFYNQTANGADEYMKVETNHGSVYYTFVRPKVRDVSGRKGSYFGLTLCINSYYADIQNIYHILSTVYQKMCLGTLLKEQQNIVQFSVADFNTKDAYLRKIHEEIINYIAIFSNGSDIKALANIPVSRMAGKEINLLECTKEVAWSAIKADGCFLVSPFYLSTQSAQIKSKCDKDIALIKQQWSQEIKNLQAEHASYTSQLQNQLQNIKQELTAKYQSRENDIKEELESLKIEKSTYEQKNSQLTQRIKEKDDKISSLEQLHKSMNNSQGGGKINPLAFRLKRFIKKDDKISTLEPQHKSMSNSQGGGDPTRADIRPKRFSTNRGVVIICSVILVLILVVGGLYYSCKPSKTTENTPQIESIYSSLEEIQVELSKLHSSLEEIKEKLSKLQSVVNNTNKEKKHSPKQTNTQKAATPLTKRRSDKNGKPSSGEQQATHNEGKDVNK